MPEATTAKPRRSKTPPPRAGLNPGDTVTNPLKPEWGPGKVVDLQRNLVFVYFRDRPGPDVIRMRESGLTPCEADPELDALPPFVAKNGGFTMPAAARRKVAKAEKAEKATK